MVKSCDRLPEPLKKPDVDYKPDELTDIEARAVKLSGRIKGLAKTTDPGQEALLDEVVDGNVWMSNLASTTFLNPKQANRMQAFLARNFGIEHANLNMSSKLSAPGRVREVLRNTRKYMGGKTIQVLAGNETTKRIAEASKQFKQFSRRAGVSYPDSQRLWTKAVEAGQYPRLLAYTNTSEAAQLYMKEQVNNLKNEMSSLGIKSVEQNNLLREAAKVSAAYDAAFRIATDQIGMRGLREGDEIIPFLNSTLTPDAQFHIKKYQQLEGMDTAKGVVSNILKSHKLTDFVVEDEKVLAYMLGRPLDEINPLIGNHRLFIRELAGLSDNQLDALVDSGVLSKVPMSSARVFEFLVDKYELPYKGIGELILTDPVQAYKSYADHLANGIAESSMVKQVYKDALDNGWGISRQTKATDPTKYKGFAPLADPQDLARHGIDPNIGNDILVHPMVKEMYQSIVEVSTNPAKMHTVAQVFQYIMTTGKSLMVATGGTVMRNTFSGVIQFAMAGGNMLRLVLDMPKSFAMLKFGTKVLDNKAKKFKGFDGKLLTERELYEELNALGKLDGVSVVGGDVGKGRNAYNPWNPTNLPRALGYVGHSLGKYGFLSGVEHGGDLLKTALNRYTYNYVFAANFIETSFKFSLYKSLLDANLINKATQFLTSAQTTSFGDILGATRHVDRYFFDYSAVGTVDKTIAKWVFPFWRYTSRNFPAQVRNAMKHPSLFVNYHRLHAQLNDPARQEEDDLPAGGVPDYLLGGMPLFFKDENGDWVTLSLTNFDPIADATMSFKGAAYSVLNLFGVETGTEKQKRDRALGEETNFFLNELLESTYAPYKAALSVLQAGFSDEEYDQFSNFPRKIKDDPLQGDETTFLGVRMPPLVKLLIGDFIPTTSQLNTLNPGGVFGTRAEFDRKTGKRTRDEQPSIFGTPRTDADSRTPFQRGLSYLAGPRFQNVDVALNMGYTESEIYAAHRDMVKTIKDTKRKLKYADPNDPKTDRIEDEVMRLEGIANDLGADLNRIKKWREERGIPDYKEWNKLKDRNR